MESNLFKAHVAISLDGYIAHKDGDISWITGSVYKEIEEYHNNADILLVGSNAYNSIFEIYGKWPYKNKTYVVSNYEQSQRNDENLSFITKQDFLEIKDIKNKNISIIGGGKLITSLINNGMIDEINIYMIPVFLGEGIKFIGKTYNSGVQFSKLSNNEEIVKITYNLNKS